MKNSKSENYEEDKEDRALLLEAERRLSKPGIYIPESEVIKQLGISEEDLK